MNNVVFHLFMTQVLGDSIAQIGFFLVSVALAVVVYAALVNLFMHGSEQEKNHE